MSHDRYTFGDRNGASRRLARLAAVYRTPTRDLLRRRTTRRPRLAVDLGCGPGHSTRLLAAVVRPRRAIGLDASPRFLREARAHGGAITYRAHDVSRSLPGIRPDLLLCRFLLTHLADPAGALAAWARRAAPGACLLIHETEDLAAEHPVLRRYYRLVDALQAHYGQRLRIGAAVAGLAARAGWAVVSNRAPVLVRDARDMAALHAENLRVWKRDPFARRSFDPAELNRLEDALDRIALGMESGGLVFNTARQLVTVRR